MAAAAVPVAAAAAATVSAAGGRADPTPHSFSAAAVVASPLRADGCRWCVWHGWRRRPAGRGDLFGCPHCATLRHLPPHCAIYSFPPNGKGVHASAAYPRGVGARASASVGDGGKRSKAQSAQLAYVHTPTFLVGTRGGRKGGDTLPVVLARTRLTYLPGPGGSARVRAPFSALCYACHLPSSEAGARPLLSIPHCPVARLPSP